MANTEQALNKAREALEEAINFIEWIEILGREGVEIYKHELRGNAEMFRGRIEPALAALTAASAEAATPANIEGPFGLALNVQHKDCHKAANAFWDYWRENGETHKRGYYESTWGAINQALKLVGVAPWTYGGTIPACAAPQASQPIKKLDLTTYAPVTYSNSTASQRNSQPVSGAMTDERIFNEARQYAIAIPSATGGFAFGRVRLLSFARALLSASGQAVSEKAACIHAYHWFGDQPSRRCVHCNAIEQATQSEKAVRDAALEEAAKICDNHGGGCSNYANQCAREIRALASTPAQQTDAPVNVQSWWKHYFDVPDALADKALSARVPGGSSVRDWFLPHDSDKATANVRDAMKCALLEVLAAAPAPVQTEAQQSEKDALVEYFHASQSLQMTIGHPEATTEDEHKAEARYEAATKAARAAIAKEKAK